MRLQHIVQTRFSVRTKWGHEHAFPREWLDHRLELFDRYCYPSLAAQTAQDFLWLLYCDESTDAEIMSVLRERERDLPQLRIALTGTILRATAPHIDRAADVFVTTRLDSDDAIHARYLEATQNRAPDFCSQGLPSWLLSFPRGYQLDHHGGVLNFDWNPRNHFHSLFERDPASTKTVLFGNHSHFHEQHPTHQDDSLAAWIQVVHGGNVKNKLRSWAPRAPDIRLADFGL